MKRETNLNDRLRIALISPQFPPGGGGGGITSASFHQALGLSSLGHDVHVYTWLDSRDAPPFDHPGITLKRLANPDWLNRLERQVNRYLSYGARIGSRGPRISYTGAFRDLRGMWTFRRLARTGVFAQYDIVEAPEWGGACALFADRRIPGVKVTKLHGSLYSHEHAYLPYARLSHTDVRLASWVERQGAEGADLVLSPSRAMAEDAHAWLGIRKSIEILPNSIDLEYIEAQAGPRAGRNSPPPKPGDELKVLFAGRVDDMKGARVLENVVRLLRGHSESGSWRFIVAGEGAVAGRYPELAQAYAGNVAVDMPGHLAMPDLYDHLRQADLFFFPSHTENCPMAVLEAMAFGLPVVASEVGGIPELIRSGQEGALCARDDATAFARALMDLRDPALRAAMGKSARARVERVFSTRQVVPHWLGLCQHAKSAIRCE